VLGDGLGCALPDGLGLGRGLAEPLATGDLRARAAALDAALGDTQVSGPP